MFNFSFCLRCAMAAVPRSTNPFLVDSDWRGKAVDSKGIEVHRGGQTVDSSFFDSVKASYSLLAFHPVSTVLLVIGLFIFLAEYHNTNGPLELIAGKLLELAKDQATPGSLVGVYSIGVFLLNLLIKFKLIVGKVCLLWFTYFVKPSQRNLLVVSGLSVFPLLKDHSYFEVILLSQIFFLYCTIRSPTYKLLLMVLGVCMFVLTLFDSIDVLSTAELNYTSQLPSKAKTAGIPPLPTRAPVGRK